MFNKKILILSEGFSFSFSILFKGKLNQGETLDITIMHILFVVVLVIQLNSSSVVYKRDFSSHVKFRLK